MRSHGRVQRFRENEFGSIDGGFSVIKSHDRLPKIKLPSINLSPCISNNTKSTHNLYQNLKTFDHSNYQTPQPIFNRRGRNYDSLKTSDIPGAVPKNRKYKDNGKKKINFYPGDAYLNDFYNKESIGGSLGQNSLHISTSQKVLSLQDMINQSQQKHFSPKVEYQTSSQAIGSFMRASRNQMRKVRSIIPRPVEEEVRNYYYG